MTRDEIRALVLATPLFAGLPGDALEARVDDAVETIGDMTAEEYLALSPYMLDELVDELRADAAATPVEKLLFEMIATQYQGLIARLNTGDESARAEMAELGERILELAKSEGIV